MLLLADRAIQLWIHGGFHPSPFLEDIPVLAHNKCLGCSFLVGICLGSFGRLWLTGGEREALVGCDTIRYRPVRSGQVVRAGQLPSCYCV